MIHLWTTQIWSAWSIRPTIPTFFCHIQRNLFKCKVIPFRSVYGHWFLVIVMDIAQQISPTQLFSTEVADVIGLIGASFGSLIVLAWPAMVYRRALFAPRFQRKGTPTGHWFDIVRENRKPKMYKHHVSQNKIKSDVCSVRCVYKIQGLCLCLFSLINVWSSDFHPV